MIFTPHGLLASALRAELRQHGHRVLVAGTTQLAAQYAATGEIDVCLLHLGNPLHLRCAEVVTQVREASPDTSVVVLTDRADATLAHAAKRAGAARVLTTSNGLTSLLAALGANRKDTPPTRPTRPAAAVSGPGSLTARESEVLVLISRGASTSEAADALQVSLSTVRGHTQRVLEKLGVHSRLQAAAVATAQGLVLPTIPTARQPLPADRWSPCP